MENGNTMIPPVAMASQYPALVSGPWGVNNAISIIQTTTFLPGMERGEIIPVIPVLPLANLLFLRARREIIVIDSPVLPYGSGVSPSWQDIFSPVFGQAGPRAVNMHELILARNQSKKHSQLTFAP